MVCEECIKCKIQSAPWSFNKELNGHLCFDCHLGWQLQDYVPPDEEE